ncbi:MAG: DUF3015 domain-containing protein [Planctomycetota bacterium]|nr:DUF3015 domain-containing protein [Planctomycetota bacterium]
MRRLTALSTLAVLALSAPLYASDDLRANVGIGLGTVIFEGQSGLLSQVLAATTNGCFGNQTFAITTGTLGARPWKGIVSNGDVQRFVADNMDRLARDIAAGEGETLETLAELIAIPRDQRRVFARNLQLHFTDIYTSPSITASEVVENIARIVVKA